MYIKFERRELYAEVWATPMSRLAPKYGLSDNGLRKVCASLNVPVPPRGYWAQLAAGQSVMQAPLPATAVRDIVYSSPPPKIAEEHRRKGDKDWLRERLDFEEQAANRVVVDPQPAHWDKALVPLRRRLIAAADKHRSLVAQRDAAAARPKPRIRATPDEDAFRFRDLDSGRLYRNSDSTCMRVSVYTFTRGLAIANTLFKAARARGFQVRVREDGSRFEFMLDGTSTTWYVAERQLSESVERTDMAAFLGPARRYTPTDKLALVATAGSGSDIQLKDGTGALLEDQLGTLFKHHYRAAVRAREQLREHVAREERRKIAEAEAAELERQRRAAEKAAAAEQARREALGIETARWHQAAQIRAYIAHLDAIGTTDAEWRAWALRVATEMDPTSDRLSK